KYYLEIDSDAQTNTKAGDAVTVPGNADGTGVPVQVHGDLVGVGPEKVEVTAKFIHGNSGSPIIYRPTGKVIGIATEVMMVHMDEIKRAASSGENHWLGFRLDNIPSSTGWVKLDWARFSDEGLKIRQMEEISQFILTLFTSKKIALTDNKQLKDAIDAYRDRSIKAAAQRSERDSVNADRGFIDRVHGIGADTIRQLSLQNLYPFHANRVKEEQELWKDLDKVVAEIDKDISTYMRNL
ncbi:MAG TPA: hypothetical protein VHH73_10185, partial [Verrucomicrobiae bacterium]|nr:hypothetical protein [Verrucomicrobiae bacterium]